MTFIEVSELNLNNYDGKPFVIKYVVNGDKSAEIETTLSKRGRMVYHTMGGDVRLCHLMAGTVRHGDIFWTFHPDYKKVVPCTIEQIVVSAD